MKGIAMKRLKFKKRTCCLLLLCLTLFLVGCDDKKTNTNKPAPSTEPTATDKDSNEAQKQKGLDIADYNKFLSLETHKDDNLQIDKFDWNICAFQLDGKNYSLPFSYSRIMDNWTFKLSDYGLDKNFKLEPLTKTSDNVKLNCEGKSYNIKVGFFNPFSTAITLDQAKIWSMEIDITTPELDEKTLENDTTPAVNAENSTTVPIGADSITGNIKPEIILPKNITMHASIASILLTYGNPDNENIHNTETGYYEFHYRKNYNVFLSLVLDEQEGLVKINYKHFPSGTVTSIPEDNNG